MKEHNLLEKLNDFGEFWLSSKPDLKFPGVLNYCPQHGLRIDIKMTLSYVALKEFVEKMKKKDTIILGSLSMQGDATFISLFTTDDIYHHSAHSTTYTCQVVCKLAILGFHAENTQDPRLRFNSFKFSLNNLDSFCATDNQSGQYGTENLVDGKIGDSGLGLCLKKITGFEYLPNKKISDIISVGYSFETLSKTNQSLANDIDNAISDVFKKHSMDVGDKELALATRNYYRFEITSQNKEEVALDDFLKMMQEVRCLLAIFMNKMLYPIKMILKKINPADNQPKDYQVLYSSHLSELQLKQAKSDTHFFHLPLNLEDVRDKLCKALDYVRNDDNSLFCEMMLTALSNPFPNNPKLYFANWCFLAEIWSGMKKLELSKYSNVFDDTENNELIKKLESRLPRPASQKNPLSSSIAELINTIKHAYPGEEGKEQDRQKKYKKELDPANLTEVNQIMQAMFMVAIYKDMGLEKTALDKARKKIYDPIIKWF